MYRFRRMSRAIACLSAAIATGALVTVAPASASTLYSSIVNRVGNLCLDVPGGTTENKKPVQVYHCNGGTNQQWEYTEGTTAGYGQLRNVAGDKCLDVRGASSLPNAVIQQYTCTGVANQQWHFDPATGHLKALHSGQCARAEGLSYKDAVVQGSCAYGYIFWALNT